MEQISTDTLKTSIEVVGQVIPLFVWVVSGCATTIVAMAVYGAWFIKYVMKIQKESNIVITKSNSLIENNTNSNNNLAKAIDDLKLVVINRKR